MTYHALPCQADHGATSVVQDETGAIMCRCDNQVLAVAIETALNAQQAAKNAAPNPASDWELQEARDVWQDDDCRIDDDAEASQGNDGTWVQAWVLIDNEPDACPNCGETAQDGSGKCISCGADLEAEEA